MRPESAPTLKIIFAASAFCVLCLSLLLAPFPFDSPAWLTFGGGGRSTGSGRKILVVYVFSATDPEYADNLRFFVEEAVHGDRRCEYVIVVQDTPANDDEDETWTPEARPDLPPHARYLHHANECYDWGTFGWVLDRHVDPRDYEFFFFINSSVRGPFLPAYARGRVHWTEPFLRRLNVVSSPGGDDGEGGGEGSMGGRVKLVGPTISCEGSPLDGEVKGKWRRNPHVQSYAVATDKEGLRILMEDGEVFRCHESRWAAIYYGELGSSSAILAAGHNLDCFMTRYQGVDWRDQDNWDCNARFSVQGENFYDGITLDPLEVMFVKVKSYSILNGISSASKAVKYQQWMHPEIWGQKSGKDAESSLEEGSREEAVPNGVFEPMKEGSGPIESAGNATEDGRNDSGDPASPPPAAGSPRASGGGGRAWGEDNPLVTSNEYLSDTPRFKIPKVLEAKARGPGCFDFEFYLNSNADLIEADVSSAAALWKHYVYFGQFESRPYRFTCPFDYERIMTSI